MAIVIHPARFIPLPLRSVERHTRGISITSKHADTFSRVRPSGLTRRDYLREGLLRTRGGVEGEGTKPKEKEDDGKRVGGRLERATRGQVATRNQGTSEPPSSHARNLQLPATRDIHTLLGPMAGKRAKPINTPSKNAPARYLVLVRACTRAKWWLDSFYTRAPTPRAYASGCNVNMRYAAALRSSV